MAAAHSFCPGYTGAFATLVKNYPDATVYPSANFRTEWGPVFHRGRLNGTAKVLVIGQDPAQHENVCRRILVGKAGQRLQGFVARLGVGNHYVMINTFVYSVYGSATSAQVVDPAIAAHRHGWLQALIKPGTKIKAVVALGTQADQAWQAWRATPGGVVAAGLTYVKITHPTADSHPPLTTAVLLQNWNAGLQALAPVFGVNPAPYGTDFAPADLVPIPEEDLPAGLPAWMRALDPWAARVSQTLLKPPPLPAPPPPPLAIGPLAIPPDNADRFERRHIAIEVPTTEVP